MFRGILGRKKEFEELVRFYEPDSIPQKQIFGYDLQKKAAEEMALTSLKISRFAILFFGISGTGKSHFPYWLVNNLNQNMKTGFSMVYAECDELSNPLLKVNDVIEQLDDRIREATRNLPSIVVFDEIDSVSESIPGSLQHAARLTKWMRSTAKKVPRGFLFVGTTNYPNEMDFTVLRSVRAKLFFEETPRKVICQLIEKELKREDAKEIAERVCEEMDKNGFVPLASDVVTACETLKNSEGAIESLSFASICETLIVFIQGIHKSVIDKYYNIHKDLINQAKKQMEYWAREFDKRTTR